MERALTTGTMNTDVMVLPDYTGMADSTSMSTIEPERMSPMDSLKAIFEEMRDSLNTLVLLMQGQGPSAADMRDEGIADADVIDPVDTDTQGNSSFPSFEKPEIGPKVGLALMMLGLTALFKYSDQIAAALEPVLKYADKFLEMLGPTGTLYLGLAGLTAIIFPKTFKSLLGAGAKGIKFAFGLLKDGFMGMKDAVTAMPGLIKSAYTGGKNLVMAGFTKLAAGFQAMRLFMLKTLIPKLASIYGASGALLMKAVGGLVAAFTGLKVFLLGTLIPSIAAIAAPFIVPIAIIAAVVAGAVAAFYSIKAGIDEFKKSLDEGDTMLEAIIEGVSTALLTLMYLPITLIKNFVAWVAEKLGFEGIATKLKEINIADSIKDGVKNLVLKAKDFVLGLFDLDFKQVLGKFTDIGAAIGRVLKGIALGSIAAVKAAFPGGESPMEAFSRVYDEVSNKGNDSPSLPDEAPKADTTDIQSIENAKKEIKENEAEIKVVRGINEQDDPEFTTNLKIEQLQSRNAELLSMIYENSLIQSDIAKKSLELQGTNSGGTVVTTINTTDASQTNQSTSNTTQTPGLAVDGSDSTARMLALQLYGSSNF
jgi:hypothetical protein